MSKQAEPSALMEKMHPLPRRFAALQENGDAQSVFYFHQPGDYLFGFLLCKETVETLHYPFMTYKMRVLEGRQDGVNLVIEEDQVIEFPANIRPRRIIDDNELIGSLVKIVFTAKRGRQKEYDVFRDKGTFRKDEQRQTARPKKKKTKAKAKGAKHG